jgi:hypothetical protein
MNAAITVLAVGKAAGKGPQWFGMFIEQGHSVKSRLRKRMQALACLGLRGHMVSIDKIVGMLKRHPVVRAESNQRFLLCRPGTCHGRAHLQGGSEQRAGLFGSKTLDCLQRCGRRLGQIARLATYHTRHTGTSRQRGDGTQRALRDEGVAGCGQGSGARLG